VTAPTDDRRSAPVAADSGAYGQPEAGAYPPPPETGRGHGFTIASVVCAIVGIVILPIVFGVLGIVFGFVGHSRGERYGKWAGLFAIVCTIAGFVLGAVVYKSMRS
jgi:hypothetical protein